VSTSLHSIASIIVMRFADVLTSFIFPICMLFVPLMIISGREYNIRRDVHGHDVVSRD